MHYSTLLSVLAVVLFSGISTAIAGVPGEHVKTDDTAHSGKHAHVPEHAPEHVHKERFVRQSSGLSPDVPENVPGTSFFEGTSGKDVKARDIEGSSATASISSPAAAATQAQGSFPSGVLTSEDPFMQDNAFNASTSRLAKRDSGLGILTSEQPNCHDVVQVGLPRMFEYNVPLKTRFNTFVYQKRSLQKGEQMGFYTYAGGSNADPCAKEINVISGFVVEGRCYVIKDRNHVPTRANCAKLWKS